MKKHPGRALFMAAVFVGLFADVRLASAQADKPPPENPGWDKFTYQPAAACTRCHAQPTGDDLPDPKKPETMKGLDIVLLTEYSIWKTHDKHAQAYAVLLGERGQKMAHALGLKEAKDITNPSYGCMNCHAMANLAPRGDPADGVDKLDGVSCSGCHGPSGNGGWIGDHAQPNVWRKLTPEQKTARGLRDLRDPEVRSRLCFSCHIGSASEGKVVTHAMFAAGHPPLPPIEVAGFARNMPPHWRDAQDVPFFKRVTADATKDAAMVKNYHLDTMKYQQTQLALVGGVVAFRETLRLARDRASFKTAAAAPAVVWPELVQGGGNPPMGDALAEDLKKRWPELALAHSDCYACHHELNLPGYRQERGFGYHLHGIKLQPAKPGRVVVRMWPTALLQTALLHANNPKRLDELRDHLNKLTAVFDSRQFGDPDALVTVADGIIRWCDEVIAEVKAAPYDQASTAGDLKTLSALNDAKAGDLPDYEAARAIASSFEIALDEWNRAAGKYKEEQPLRAEINKMLVLRPYSQRKERLDITLKVINAGSGGTPASGQKEFLEYVARLQTPGAPGFDEAITKDLVALTKGNDFLARVRGLGNADFNQGFDKYKDEIQALGDKEEKAILEAIDRYSPFTFLEKLHEIARTLPK